MSSLQILGIPLVLIGGVTLFILVTFQILSGLGTIQVAPKYHKWVGLLIFILGIFHAIFGLLYIYGG